MFIKTPLTARKSSSPVIKPNCLSTCILPVMMSSFVIQSYTKPIMWFVKIISAFHQQTYDLCWCPKYIFSPSPIHIGCPSDNRHSHCKCLSDSTWARCPPKFSSHCCSALFHVSFSLTSLKQWSLNSSQPVNVFSYINIVQPISILLTVEELIFCHQILV